MTKNICNCTAPGCRCTKSKLREAVKCDDCLAGQHAKEALTCPLAPEDHPVDAMCNLRHGKVS